MREQELIDENNKVTPKGQDLGVLIVKYKAGQDMILKGDAQIYLLNSFIKRGI